MYVMLATLKQFNFCYLLRFIIISSVHAASSMCMRETLEFKNLRQASLKKVLILASFSAGRKDFLIRRRVSYKSFAEVYFNIQIKTKSFLCNVELTHRAKE